MTMGSRDFEEPFAYGNLVPGSVLDIGASSASLQHVILGDGHELTIVDVAASPPAGLSDNARFICMNVKDISSDIGTFDNILLVSTLEHVSVIPYDSPTPTPLTDQMMVLDKCVSLLNPGGVLILTVPYGTTSSPISFHLFYSKDTIEKIRNKHNVILEEYCTPVEDDVGGKFKLCAPDECTVISNYTGAANNTPIGVAMLVIKRS